MRERLTLLSQEKEKSAMETVSAAPSLTNPNTAFSIVSKVGFF